MTAVYSKYIRKKLERGLTVECVFCGSIIEEKGTRETVPGICLKCLHKLSEAK